MMALCGALGAQSIVLTFEPTGAVNVQASDCVGAAVGQKLADSLRGLYASESDLIRKFRRGQVYKLLRSALRRLEVHLTKPALHELQKRADLPVMDASGCVGDAVIVRLRLLVLHDLVLDPTLRELLEGPHGMLDGETEPWTPPFPFDLEAMDFIGAQYLPEITNGKTAKVTVQRSKVRSLTKEMGLADEERPRTGFAGNVPSLL